MYTIFCIYMMYRLLWPLMVFMKIYVSYINNYKKYKFRQSQKPKAITIMVVKIKILLVKSILRVSHASAFPIPAQNMLSWDWMRNVCNVIKHVSSKSPEHCIYRVGGSGKLWRKNNWSSPLFTHLHFNEYLFLHFKFSNLIWTKTET